MPLWFSVTLVVSCESAGPNVGLLSLMSNTMTVRLTEEDRGGLPLSLAYKNKLRLWKKNDRNMPFLETHRTRIIQTSTLKGNSESGRDYKKYASFRYALGLFVQK